MPSRDEAKKSLKASLVAPPGYVVINSDSSQIEARVLAWLANQIELVTAFREGRDVYSEFASLRYGRTITKKDTVERFLGKTCILGLGYGTGAEKLRSTLKIQGKVELSLDEAKELVSLYRATYYKIPQLWKALEQDLHDIMQVEEPRYALPNELYLHYANLRILDGKMVYDNRNGIKGIWGGAIAENVTQALARILIGYQMIKIANQGYRPALTVHDSLVYVVPKPKQDEAIQIIRAGMSAIPDWAEGLPLTCEIKVGSNYAEV